MRGVFGQHPGALPQAPAQSAEFLQQLQLLGWVDRTALVVLAVFFVLGLFKGLIWQVSRVAILVLSYMVAGQFGEPLGHLLARSPAVGGTAGPAPVDPPGTTLYIAYLLVFLVVLVVLSLLALLLQKLAAKAGLGFFDRLGGGVLGVATGGCVVLFGLFVVHMFFQGSQLASAAETSHSLRLSCRAIDWLGPSVPDELRLVFRLQPLHAPAPAVDPAADPLADPNQPTATGRSDHPGDPAAPDELAPEPPAGGEPTPNAPRRPPAAPRTTPESPTGRAPVRRQ